MTAPIGYRVATGDTLLDALLYGTFWDGPIGFGFPDTPDAYAPGYGLGEPDNAFAPARDAVVAAARRILTGDAETPNSPPVGTPAALRGLGVTQFTTLDLAERANPEIRIAESSRPPTAWAYSPGAAEGGDVWLGTAFAATGNDLRSPGLGNYAALTLMHELGHALGLKHAHEPEAGRPALPTEWDSLEFTVMTYRSFAGGPADRGYSFETWGAPQSWMMLDIAALQTLYGANYDHRAGDTTYRWNPSTGEMTVDGEAQGRPGANRVFLTVWDGGGRDTYDLGNYAFGVAVDLAPGGHSVLAATQLATLGPLVKARGNVFNALLHQGDTRSLIEDAIGGGGADTLRGNAAANHLRGQAGNDALWGGEGQDTLDGGLGADTLEGGVGADTYRVSGTDDVLVERPLEGLDTILADLSWVLAAEFEMLELLGEADLAGTGNATPNRLTGNAGANSLVGAAGDDTLEGHDGADTLHGGNGADQLIGGIGNDTFIVDTAADTARELAGEGTDTVFASLSWELGTELEALVLTGTAAIDGAGNGLANAITGNGGANLLSGRQGDDTLAGAGGNDTLAGDRGADQLIGGPGDDRFIDVETVDRIVEKAAGGFDTIETAFAFALPNRIEALVLTGRAAIDATGNRAANLLVGNAGRNRLDGTDGDDTLTGGGGGDVFVLTLDAGVETITDFTQGEDVIELHGLDPDDGDAIWVFASETGLLAWDADGAGAGAATSLALLGIGVVLAATDLVFVA